MTDLHCSTGGITEPSDQAVQAAALFIQDAFDGVERVHPRETVFARKAHLLHLFLHHPTRAVLIAFLLLGFFERPTWSIGHSRYDVAPQYYPTFELPVLDRWQASLLEFLFIVYLALDVLVQVAMQSPGRFFGHVRQSCYTVLLCITFLDATLATFTPWEVRRPAPYLRLSLIILQHENMRMQLAIVARCLPALCGVLLVLVGFLIFGAWAGTLLFHETEEGDAHFKTLPAGLWSMLICLTTANFPDVMMQVYVKNRFAIFFFAPFLLLGNWFLLNLVLAVVYKAHEDSRTATAEAATNLRNKMLTNAFHHLDAGNTGSITMEVVRRVFFELNHYRDIAYIDEERARLLFATLDTSGDNNIDEGEFGRLYDLLRISFERVPKRTWLQRCLPQVAASRGFQSLSDTVKSHNFDVVVDVVLVLNAITLLAEQFKILGLGPTAKTFDGVPDTVWNAIELVFGIVFFTEMIIKMAVYGWVLYWRDLKNAFDALVTLATVGTIVIVYLPNQVSNSRLIRIVLLVRLMRLLRLLGAVQSVQFISKTFVSMLPEAMDLLKVLFCLTYAFASLGVQIFGGLINTDPEGPQFAELQKTAFGDALYYPNSFNDLGSGFVTCFELLIVNNWFVLADGYAAVSRPSARIFFVGFYVVGVLICLNILVAFAIGAFMETAERAQNSGQQPGESLHEARFDAAHVTGTHTGLEGEWRAVASTSDPHQLAVLRGVSAGNNSRRALHTSGQRNGDARQASLPHDVPGAEGEGL